MAGNELRDSHISREGGKMELRNHEGQGREHKVKMGWMTRWLDSKHVLTSFLSSTVSP